MTRAEAEEAVERALDAALGEVRRQGGVEYLLREARTEGVSAARVYLNRVESKPKAG